MLRDTNVEAQVLKIGELLKNQRHQPELSNIYILLGICLSLQLLGLCLIQFLKNCLVYWILKNQAEQAVSYMLGHPYSEATNVAPCCTPSFPPTTHTPLVERLRPKPYKEDAMAMAINFSGHEITPLSRAGSQRQTPPLERHRKSQVVSV